MSSELTLNKNTNAVKIVLLDLLFLTFIYFVPALTHLFALPIYYIEPMRLMLVFAMLHTSKYNSIVIALTLPLFSFIISAHPSIFKTGLISIELLINVLLFFSLKSKIKNIFFLMAVSVIASKVIYYLLKYVALSFTLINGSLISTPLLIQIVMTLIFSGYAYQILKREEK
ncbi:MAG: hypothetical protein KF721_01995 [Ignavibacteriaceae bacterium]|nr:hypothetical protein [Ignavibacteriaceae bacterium]